MSTASPQPADKSARTSYGTFARSTNASSRTYHALGYVLMGLSLIVGLITFYSIVVIARQDFLLDVGVFRDAGQAFVDGDPLYGDEFPTRSGFAFIYPPFAALLFVPLTLTSELTMDIIWTLSIIGSVFLILGMACHRLGLKRGWIWALGLTGFALCFDPIFRNLYYGQINVFLILLVTMDVLGYTPKKIRGIGIGIAAGIKITPAAYAAVFLVRKDWWSIARSAGFFLLTAAIGFAVRPRESIYFWTEEFFATDRGGAPGYPPNQGLTGLLVRAGLDSASVSRFTPLILAIFAAVSMYIAYRLEQHGRIVESLLVVVLAIALGGPFAVSHHWAGVVLVLPIILAIRENGMRLLLMLFAGAIIAPAYDLYIEQDSYIFEWPLWLHGNLIGITGLGIFIAYFFLVTWFLDATDKNAAVRQDTEKPAEEELLSERS